MLPEERSLRKLNEFRINKQLDRISETDEDIPLDEFIDTTNIQEKGLKTGLHSTYTSMEPPTNDPKIEQFLRDVQVELLKQLDDYMKKFHDCNTTSNRVKQLKYSLKNSTKVAIQTDKTNSFVLMETEEYEELVIEKLKEHGAEITITDLKEAHEEAKSLLEGITPWISKQEKQFLIQCIQSKAIPTPKLLVKDHKQKKEGAKQFPTRLIVPGQNFIAGFPQMGYKALKHILDNNHCDNQKYLIQQSSYLKEHLEGLQLKADSCTIISIDAKDYYPSVRFKLVKKAIEFFTKDLPAKEKTTVELGLRLIKQGMNSTFVTFKDKYYRYDGNQYNEE